MAQLGEMRCSECLKASRYSKIMLRFSLGCMTSGGTISARCKCGHTEVLSVANHNCDRVSTFRVVEQVEAAMP